MFGLDRSQWRRVAKMSGSICLILSAMIVLTDGGSRLPGGDNVLPQVIVFTAGAIAPLGVAASGLLFILSKPWLHIIAVLAVSIAAGVGVALGTFIISLY